MVIYIYKFVGKKDKTYELEQKLNSNCPAEEKSGTGPGSCGGASGKSSEDSSKSTPTSKSGNPFTEKSRAARRNTIKIAQDLYQGEYALLKRIGNKGLSERDRDEKKWETYKRFVGNTIVNKFPDGVPDDLADALEDENMHTMANAIADLGLFENDKLNKLLKSRTTNEDE